MRIYIKTIPRASRNKIEKISEGEYKVWLTAAPINNKANEKLVEVLADYFAISKSLIKIIGGKTSKTKIIEIFSET